MYFKYKNTQIYYEKHNTSNDNIIILPGWGNNRITFNNIINNLKDKKIYILDYPGFGKSKPLKEEYTIYDYAELIYNFIKKNNITNPTIIAHSFGGRVTAILISKYKLKINKLLLIDVAGIKRISLKKYIYKVLKLLIKPLPNKYKVKLQNKLFNLFASTDYKNIDNNMKKTFQNIINEDLKKHYKNISCETLIIWGENDYDTPLKDAYILNRIIKNSELIIYPKANHFSYLNYPILTNKILDSYIKKENN